MTKLLSIRPTAALLIAGLACLPLAVSGQSGKAAPGKNELLVYIGTYTGAKSKGIYKATLDLASGALSPPELAADTPSPSFLAVHPRGGFLYSVNEVNTAGGNPAGSVSAFTIDRTTGKLTALNQESSGGPGPAHLIVDTSGANVLVANYGGGSVAALPIEADGRLKPPSAFIQHTGSSVNPSRQKGPHAHSVNVSPDNRFAYVADLGLDKVLIYRFDAKRGSLTPNDPGFATATLGAGPRHFAFHPKGRFAYVINEIDLTVTAFSHDPKRGTLTTLESVSTLPEGVAKVPSYSTAEVQVHPSGKFLYGSNRGHDSITVFAIDGKSGKLTYVQNEPTQGNTPRGFGIDPTGTFLLAGNQRSDSVVVFRIDQQTGRLTPTGHKIEVGSPVCVKFVKAAAASLPR